MLPAWWTSGLPVRGGVYTREDEIAFYSSDFVRDVLGHTGGITTLPIKEAI